MGEVHVKEIGVNDIAGWGSIVDAAEEQFGLSCGRRCTCGVDVGGEHAVVEKGGSEETDLFRFGISLQHVSAVVSAGLGAEAIGTAENVVVLIVSVGPDTPLRVIGEAVRLREGVT